MTTINDLSLVQSIALLLLKLIDDIEARAIAGVTDDELDAALADPQLMLRARAEAVKLSINGGRAEVRATRALDAAAARLQLIAESTQSRSAEVIAAANALCTLAGTREKLRARHLSQVGPTATPATAYAFYLGDEALSADERQLVIEHRSKHKALASR